MIRRQTLMPACRRASNHGSKPCYYCWRKSLIDSLKKGIPPEERLLMSIFGQGRHIRYVTDRIRRKERKVQRESARRLLSVTPTYSWTDGSHLVMG